jgi:hypothetical protein
MDDVFAHPVVVATYVAVLSAFFAGVRALFNLFNRVKMLESETRQVRQQVHELAESLREHMLEEERHSAELRAVLKGLESRLPELPSP